jgi:hypothetical protein
MRWYLSSRIKNWILFFTTPVFILFPDINGFDETPYFFPMLLLTHPKLQQT